MDKLNKKSIGEILKSDTDLNGSYTGIVEDNEGNIIYTDPVQDVDDL